MKRFSYYFAIIATAILFLQQGCTSNQNKEQNVGATDQLSVNTDSQDSNPTFTNDSPEVSYDYSNNEVIDYKKAAIIAHDYVEEKMGKCKSQRFHSEKALTPSGVSSL